MSDTHDRDLEPDPIDTAYDQAEAILSDDEARAARRARVLAAVSRETANPPTPSSAHPLRRPSGWGRGGWLAAAGVAGLSVLVASQVYRPVPRAAPAAASASSIPAPGPRAAPPEAAAPAPVTIVTPPPSAPRAEVQVAPTMRGEAAAAPPLAPVAAQEPPALVIRPMEAPKPPPPAPPVAAAPAPEAKVQGYFEGRFTADAQNVAAARAKSAGPPAAAAALAPDPGAKLRDAAAQGRAGEVEFLLNQGTPVDAPAANGDTALMQSVRTDHPAVAAILLRRGASLDRKNNAGESARDMAAQSGDTKLDRALGLKSQ